MVQGLVRAMNPSASNRVSAHASVEEEQAEREALAAEFIDTIRPQLPALLQSLAKIEDYRNPKKIEHQLTMVLLYGILCFVLQTSSRREANRELSGPVLLAHLRKLFPELEKLPHQDTLNRILSRIDVEGIQQALLEMIRRLIRNKKFNRWLVAGCYPIAIDGTQKAARRELLSPEWLQRRINAGTDNETTQYYVYVLEAQLAFANGLTLPLMSEFLNYAEGDTSADKQDCETRAFHRLARRLKEAFPRLPIILLLDGLYPNGPVLQTCRENRWQFMIVLKDDSLPSVWEEYEGLRKLEPGQQARRTWGNRRQHFRWVNFIEYYWGPNRKKKQVVHVVVCEERWEEIDAEGDIVEKRSRHAWLSSEPLAKETLHERCNLGARHRWGIEEAILVEKHHGYHYEHLFSYNWKAMKGYHYLMHLGHALNALAQYSEHLYEIVVSLGVRAFLKCVRESLRHPWLDPERLYERLRPDPQLRLA
ncbi:MAG: transposase family protein [Pseudomonadota bacterium]